MSIPTLSDIAAMPFPASQTAMRKFYDPTWCMPCTEGMQIFRVYVSYTITTDDSVTLDIEAENEEEAKKLAMERAGDESGVDGDFDVNDCRIVPPLGQKAAKGSLL